MKRDWTKTGKTTLGLAGGMAMALVFLAGCASTQEWENDNFNRHQKHRKQSELEKRKDDFENHQRNRERRRRLEWEREMEERMDKVDPPWWKYPRPRLDEPYWLN